jgi:hypothetical protein
MYAQAPRQLATARQTRPGPQHARLNIAGNLPSNLQEEWAFAGTFGGLGLVRRVPHLVCPIYHIWIFQTDQQFCIL